ncbi:MAG TPA: hypothetical protein DHV28_05800 [Ignavibacteriales bacterium]|nr:hypothetical protein [Ignavibacteriales bacterium]
MQKPLSIFQKKIVLFVVLLFFIISIFDLSIAQVIIKEKVDINPVTIPLNNNQLIDTSQTHKIDYLGNVQRKNIPGDNPQSTVTIPFYGRATVEVTLSDAASSSRVSLEIRQPEYQMLSEYANHNVGFTWTSDNMIQGTSVEFGIDWYWNKWGTIYQGKEAGVITTQIDSTEYTMGFEALGDDWDYNELVIRVKFIPTEIVVTIDPPLILPGDTANVIIKNKLADGTLIDFPPTQKFEAAMLDGCIYGQLKAGADSGAYLNNVFQPIIFIADTGAVDSGAALLRVGLVRETPLNKLNLPADITYECFTGYFISNNYNDAEVSIDNPLFIIYPTPFTVERISEEPRMPTVVCKATLKKFYPGTIKYEWKYIVRKFYSRRWSDSGSLACVRISRSEFQGISYSFSGGYTEWTVPFIKDSGYFYFKSLQQGKNKYDILNNVYGCNGDTNVWYDSNTEIFTGGEVLVSVTAKYYHNGQIIAKLDTLHLGKILGSEVSDNQTIFNYANSNKIKAIMYQESKFHQFTYPGIPSHELWPYDGEGWPLYGEPNGYGLTQLDCDPAAKERELWNWKANVDGGKSRLQKCYDEVVKNHGLPNEEKYNLTNAFHNYNHGNKKTYYTWKGKKDGWKPEPYKDDYGFKRYEKYEEYGGGN